MSTLKELISKESPEVQRKIKEQRDQYITEYSLFNLRKELEVSQAELADALHISQPSVRTLKKYVEALGGEISLLVNLPSGEGRVYRL